MPRWNPDVDEQVEEYDLSPGVFDFDAFEDGRCKASSWRAPMSTQQPGYYHYFGPGGFNRCLGPKDHVNHLHKDEWGNVFALNPFRVVRKEARDEASEG